MFHALERSVVSRVSAGESEAAVSFGNGATWAAVAQRSGGRRIYGLGRYIQNHVWDRQVVP